MVFTWSYLALFLLSFLWVSRAEAGNTTCLDPTVTWWNGKNGENPCQMYQRMVQTCVPDFQMYSTQAPPLYNICPYDCCCSTVAYALESACWSCQWGQHNNPETYNTFLNCSSPSTPGSLTPQLQSQLGAIIPDWAYTPYDRADIWSYDAARAKALGLSSSTSTSSSQTATTPSHSSSATADPSPSSNIAAIVGGVVGGTGGIAIGILLGFLWFKRVQRKEAVVASRKVQGFQPATFGGQPLGSYDGLPLTAHPHHGTPQAPPFRTSGPSPMERFTPPLPPPSPSTRVKGAVAPNAVKRYDTMDGHRSPLPPPSTNPPSSQTQSPPPSHGQRPSESFTSPLSPTTVRYEREEDAGLARETGDGGVEVVRLPPTYRNEWYQG